MLATLPELQETDFPSICRGPLEILQVNMGYRCNQQCVHCHVNAGPGRTEVMDSRTVGQIIDYLHRSGLKRLDITGGAPELNPEFRQLVINARKLGVSVIDRCNLTILEEPDQEDLAQFLAEHNVEIVASLPCYQKENVDKQRGRGVFDKSIKALKRLNALGYAQPGTGLELHLVFNPIEPVLPPSQCALEQDYRQYFTEHYNVSFNNLYTLTNMPIKRFGSMLLSTGQFHGYMQLLRNAHDNSNLESVMCRSLISLDWQGYVYDCDFNQMLELDLRINHKTRVHISEIMESNLEGNPIMIADHCYGCTAGQGSSCGGSLL